MSGDASDEGVSGALLSLAQNLGNQHSLEALLRALPSELQKIVDAAIVAFIPWDGDQDLPDLVVDRHGRSIRLELSAFRSEELWWNSANDPPMPVVLSTLDSDGGAPAWALQFRVYGIQSLCLLPLVTPVRRLGMLCIAHERPDAFSPSEIRFLRALAGHAALLVDDRINFDNAESARSGLESEKTRLRLILDLNNSVVSNLELRSLLRAISPSIRKIMELDLIGLILPEAEGKQLRLYALDFPGSKGIIREDMLSPIDGSIVGKVFRSGEPWTGRLSDLKDWGTNLRLGSQEGVKVLCFLPLLRRDTVLGVLSLARLHERPFTDSDLEFLAQIANQIAIAKDNALAYRKITELTDRLTQEKLYFEDEIRSEMNFEEIVGNSAVLRKVLRQIETVAPTDSTVLIYGETGSGKELIARAVHNLSRRKSNAFVKLNCAAIPTGLLESELFGHEKGAFTGAVSQRIGRFELANEGTMFLDEVAEIPLELQPKLLRVLQEREFERLGGSRTQRTNARLIAATNRDLEAMVEQHQFRSDLFYRLNVFPIRVPSLRERPEDIPLLVRHFVQHFSRNMNKQIDTISKESMKALTRYTWPGNIRELQNVIERAVILCQGRVLTVPLSELKPKPAGNGAYNGHATLEEVERQHILSVLEQTNWVLAGPNGAAARLGIKRPTLQFRIQKLGISRPRSHSSEN